MRVSQHLFFIVFLQVCILVESWGFQDADANGIQYEWIAKAGGQLNLGRRNTTNLRGFISMGTTMEINNNMQADLSASINIYSGGIGTNQGVNHRWQFVGDLNIVGGITSGWGYASAMTMNVFHNFSGNTVNSAYDGSLSIGLIRTISTLGGMQPGRNQFNGYVYLKGGPVSLGMYNDLFAGIFFPQNDSYWTGGGEIQFDAGFGVFSFIYDGFTGLRPNSSYNLPGPGGFMYYVQSPLEEGFNNGLTSIRFSTPEFAIGINHVGNSGRIMNGQWFQNLIHDNWNTPLPRFLNLSTESLQLSISGLWNEHIGN